MATTLVILDAGSWDPDVVPVVAGDLPGYNQPVQGRDALVFPDGANETAFVSKAFTMPQAYAGGTLHLHVGYISGATANAIQWEAYVEAVTDGDSVDLDAGTSFDSANTANPTVPGTAGHLDIVDITLTNKDSVAAGDLVRILLRRDSDHANDSAAATAYVWFAELRE